MGVTAGQRVRILGALDGGRAINNTGRRISTSFDMEVTSAHTFGTDHLTLCGVELTRAGKERMSHGCVVSRRVDVTDADFYVIGQPAKAVDAASELAAKISDLANRALFLGYDLQAAARVSDVFTGDGYYGDECETHPALRVYLGGHSEECEACTVLRMSTETGYTPARWADIQLRRAAEEAEYEAAMAAGLTPAEFEAVSTPTPVELAETAFQAHYANACSEDPEISFYASETYRGSELALLRAIAAAYPDVSADGVRDLLVDGFDRVSDAVDRWRDDLAFNIIDANNAAIEDAAWRLLQSSPVQGPQLPSDFVVHCGGGEYVDRTLPTASWWDRYTLTPGTYPMIGTFIDGTPCKEGDDPYYYTAKISATLVESYRVSRLFNASVSHTEYPDKPTTVYVRVYGYDAEDGFRLNNYGDDTFIRLINRKAGI